VLPRGSRARGGRGGGFIGEVVGLGRRMGDAVVMIGFGGMK
jgi:hypothetical protein